MSNRLRNGIGMRVGTLIAMVGILLLAVVGVAGTATAATNPTPTSVKAQVISNMHPNAFGWCDGLGPGGNADSITAETVSSGLTVELRFSPSARCAWGRIRNAQVGAEIWTDRSSDGGAHWQGWLGYRLVSTGTDTYTNEYDDAGVVMRACGTWYHGGAIFCTGWY